MFMKENLDLTINLWDTPANDPRAILYCRDAYIFVMIFDVTRQTTLDYVVKQFEEIQKFNSKVLFYLVGNKCDLKSVVDE